MTPDDKPTVEDFFLAVRMGEADTLADFVAAGIDINVKNANGDTALMVAADGGDEHMVTALLALKADTSVKDMAENTVIHRVIRKSNKDMLRLLASSGADLETRDRMGNSPLETTILTMIGAPQNGREMFDILLDAGADATATDQGVTSVMWAAMADSAYALRRLVAKGANVHAIGKLNQTALTVAANNDAREVAKELLAMGVDTEVVDNEGLTAYTRAVKNKFTEFAGMVRRHEHITAMKAMQERSSDTEAPPAATFRKKSGPSL